MNQVTPFVITNYLNLFHPNILEEMQRKMSAIECTPHVLEKVINLSCANFTDKWERRMVLIASCLLLFTPETIYANCLVRKGVASKIAESLGVSQQAVSKQVAQSRYYYSRTPWCREAVDKIVKEVRGGEVNG